MSEKDELFEELKAGGAKLASVPEDELKAREEEKKKRMEELQKLKATLESKGVQEDE